MVSVLVLEDHTQMREHFVKILESWEEISHLEAVATNKRCAEILKKTDFDVLLVDLDLPDGSGLELIQLHSALNPNGLSIVISALSDGQTIITALELGAIGYLHKDDNSLQIIESIRLAMLGQSPVSPSIANIIISKIQSSQNEQFEQSTDDKKKGVLTDREVEVLSLIAKGLSYNEAANVLGISKNTLPVHIRNIYRKLHAANRSEAVYEARFFGIIK